MTTSGSHDTEVEKRLQRAAGYLTKRGFEYLEHPTQALTQSPLGTFRYRRVVAGSIAASLLCLTAVVASFVGGMSSGKVDVAEAAWAAVPSVITNSERDEFSDSCNPVVAEFWKSGSSTNSQDSSVPEVLQSPSLVDFRGTTKLGVYFGGDLILVCLLLEGKNVMVQRVDGFGGAIGSAASGTLTALTLAIDERAVGLVFGNLPAEEKSVSSVKIVQIGQTSAIEASVVAGVDRYVAWSPNLGDVAVRFVSQQNEEIGSLGPKAFLPPCLGSCALAPTTVPNEGSQ